CSRSSGPPVNVGPDAQSAAMTTAGDAKLDALATAFVQPEEDRAKPPGFGGATAWLNVDHPLSLDELRGKVVVVDFWTSCCINCIHTLPTLSALEDRFADQPVVVVGVHSPKFDAESEAS